MKNGLRFDHAVIRVNDLAAARADYADLGFTVVPGGEHPGRGSHNALIAFADGSYIELIAFPAAPPTPAVAVARPVRASALRAAGRSPIDCRVLPWETAGEGFVDYALLPNDIDRVLRGARERGLVVEGPFPGGRARPDGRKLAWQFGVPDGYDLPFLCADITPRSLRVPEGAARQHANGATGIRRILVVVADLAGSVRRYTALLGLDAESRPAESEISTRATGFALGGTTIQLVQPAAEDGEMRRYLDARGEGTFALDLTGTGASGRELDPRRTHQARIVLASDWHAVSAGQRPNPSPTSGSPRRNDVYLGPGDRIC